MTHTCTATYRGHFRHSPVLVERLPVARVRKPTHQEIAALAYSYWEERGRQAGWEWDDWFRAERALGGNLA
jgi:Protein of unknown function (DUF2934)